MSGIVDEKVDSQYMYVCPKIELASTGRNSDSYTVKSRTRAVEQPYNVKTQWAFMSPNKSNPRDKKRRPASSICVSLALAAPAYLYTRR